jgi:hypothetical protein
MTAAAIAARVANRATASHDLNARRRTITTKSIATNPTAVAAWTPPGATLFIAASATASPQSPSASRILRGVGNESTLSRRLKNRSNTMIRMAPLAIAASADMATKGAAALPADGTIPANMSRRTTRTSADMKVVTVLRTKRSVSALCRSLVTIVAETIKASMVK